MEKVINLGRGILSEDKNVSEFFNVENVNFVQIRKTIINVEYQNQIESKRENIEDNNLEKDVEQKEGYFLYIDVNYPTLNKSLGRYLISQEMVNNEIEFLERLNKDPFIQENYKGLYTLIAELKSLGFKDVINEGLDNVFLINPKNIVRSEFIVTERVESEEETVVNSEDLEFIKGKYVILFPFFNSPNIEVEKEEAIISIPYRYKKSWIDDKLGEISHYQMMMDCLMN